MAHHRTNQAANADCRSPISTTRLWFSCLLCLCAWRGPMPIVHCHSLQSQVLAGDVHLAAHAASHHAHDIDHSSGGWHIHFLFPANGSDDLPADDDTAAPGPVCPTPLLEHAGPGPGGDFGPSLASDSDSANAEVARPDCLAWLQLPDPRLASEPPDVVPKRVSPQARLCVARC